MVVPPTSSRLEVSRINSMLSVWYGIIFGGLQAFLIVQNVRNFVWFAELSWPHKRTPFLEVNCYIILTGLSVLLLPFFVAASVFRIGNTANDNRLLGKDLNSKDEWASMLLPKMLYQGTKGFFRTIWTHSGPTSSFIHVVSSFCLLLPQTLMDAALLKYGYLPNDSVWSTDLDVMIPQGDRNAILKILGNGNSGTNGIGNNIPDTVSFLETTPRTSMRLEYINYGLAILIFSIRYASVFWHSNKGFAAVFSLQVLINCCHTMISFSAFTVLFKAHVVGTLKLLHASIPFILSSYAVLLLYILSITILLGSSSVLYHYGYMKVAAFVDKKVLSTCVTNRRRERSGLWLHLPHCFALAVFLALAASQCLLIHDAKLLFDRTLDNCLLAYIISSGIHFLLWIILWIVLSCKSDWKFNVNVKVGNVKVGDLQSLKLAADICLGDVSDNGVGTPLGSSMLVVTGGKAFAVMDIAVKSRVMEVLHGDTSLTREGESADRIYWPRSCPATQTCNSLEDEIQPWLKESKECSLRNKVTFYDDAGSPRKYSSVPISRGGATKRSFKEKYMEIKQNEDEGDYAVLKRGKGCLKTHVPLEAEELHQQHNMGRYLVHQTIPGPGSNKYDMSMNCPILPLRHEANVPQTTPMSTDSGYTGTVDRQCPSESRSASSTGSPPDRSTAHSESSSSGVHSSSTLTGGVIPQHASNDYCPNGDCCNDPYGRIGQRRESMRSTNLIHEGMSSGKNPPSIYQSRSRPKSQMDSENQYGESRRQVHESYVPMSLESPPYQPSNPVQAQSSKYTNINTANEIAERQNTNVVSDRDIYGRTGQQNLLQPVHQFSPPIQSTPYGRCTNMKLSSFTDYGRIGSPIGSTHINDRIPPPMPSTSDSCIPPTPPPLPELSFNHLKIGNTRYSPQQHHTTLPNGVAVVGNNGGRYLKN